MGVYIKGMKMPDNCTECQKVIGCCEHNEDGTVWCRLAKSYIGDERTVCPFIEVQSHGRLIDADELVEDLERQCKEVFRIDAVSPDDYWITRNEAYNEALWKTWVESFDNYLKTRPTVIPADKDGET